MPQVIPGGAEQRFGIYVALPNGLPERLVGRAEGVLPGQEETCGSRGEEETQRQRDQEISQCATRNSQLAMREEPTVYHARAETCRAVLPQIADADISSMTPLQALNVWNAMQLKINAKESADVEQTSL